MLKKINQLLKLIGFNLVHAKRSKKAKAGYRVHVPIEDAKTDCVPRTKRADFDDRWHYQGDSCPGGHKDGFESDKHVDASPTQDNNITGSAS